MRKWPKKVPQIAKQRFFAHKTGFCAQNHFFTEKWENERKSAKRVKMGFKTPKKALSTEGFARWAQNEHLRSIKTPIFAKFRTFAPKTRFGRFVQFWAQKERKSILGDFWLQKRAQMLMFYTVWRSGWKRWFFVKKLLFGEEKTIKKLFLARHKNMKSCQKMKKVIFTHFRQKRKTLYKRNVLGTLFRPESQKRDFSTFGSKKVKMS